jgi:hypothetical protein
MSDAVGQDVGVAALPPRGIGEILSTAFRLYRRHWQTLFAIAAVAVVPLTLLEYVLGHWIRTQGELLTNDEVVSTSFWRVVLASLVAAVVGVRLYLVLSGAITRATRPSSPVRIQTSSRATALG